ncbi:MAG: hypothetical protein ACYSWP_07430 [Planctomycetota bacterium]|jgi:hypothetical protein
MPPWEKYKQKPWEKSRGNPQQANNILNSGITSNATPEQINVIESNTAPQDMEMQTYIAYMNAKTGTNFTPEMAEANLRFEYGEDATPQVANQMNKKASKWQEIYETERVIDPKTGLSFEAPKVYGLPEAPDPEKYVRPEKETGYVLGSFIENTKAALKALPELATTSAIVSGMSPQLDPRYGVKPSDESIERYYKNLQTVGDEIEKVPMFMELRESMIPNVQKSQEMITKYRGTDARPLIDSAKAGNWTRFGTDLADTFALEMPNFATIMGLSLVNPSAGLAYAGTSSAGNRYAEGIESGEDPVKASGAAVGHGLAEVVFERIGSTGMISDMMTRSAKGEFIQGFGRRALELAREPASEIGTTMAQNLIDDRPLYEGVLESGLVGLGFGGAMTPFTVGDATRIKKQNTTEQIAEIVQNDPVLSETLERAELATEALNNPTEENVEALNRDIFEQEEVQEEAQAEVAEEVETEPVVEEIAEPTGYMTDIETMDDVSNVTRSKSKVMNKIMTPFIEYVGDVSPKLKTKITNWEFDTHQRKKDYTERSSEFLETALNISKQDPFAFTEAQLALKNRDFDKAEKILGKTAMDQIREISPEIADELNAVGYEFERMEDHFPRRVKDLKGLREHLGKEMGNQIDDAIAEQQRKAKNAGYTLSEIEIQKIINNVISGSYRPVGGRKPKSLKRRTIDEITPEMDQYYYDAIESWIMYINEVSDVIEVRKLLGKDIKMDGDVVDMNESIGAVIRDIQQTEGLNEEEVNALIGAMRARLGYRPTGKVGQAYRSLVAMTTLGQFTNAITQIGDYTWSFYENGLFDTIGATGDVVSGSGVTMKDLGIDEMSAEFRTPNGMHDAVDKLFKFTGLKAIDRLGKETLVNASFRQYQEMAKRGEFSPEKQEKLDSLFGAEQDSVINDLKNGERSRDVDLLLFSTALDWHPTTLSNMPIAYLEHPNGRILYTLKTFTIKQLDNFRRVGTDDLIEGVSTGDMALARQGFGRLMKLAAIMLAINVPIDSLKDFLTGKDIDWSDTIIDNLFKLFGASRYNAIRSTRKGQKVSESLLREIFPPFPFLDYPAEDLKMIKDNLEDGDDIDLMNLESWNMVPFVGRGVYWRWGKGEQKEEKRREQEK